MERGLKSGSTETNTWFKSVPELAAFGAALRPKVPSHLKRVGLVRTLKGHFAKLGALQKVEGNAHLRRCVCISSHCTAPARII